MAHILAHCAPVYFWALGLALMHAARAGLQSLGQHRLTLAMRQRHIAPGPGRNSIANIAI